jgi:hypothetical protein
MDIFVEEEMMLRISNTTSGTSKTNQLLLIITAVSALSGSALNSRPAIATANVEVTQTECYLIQSEQAASDEPHEAQETWCYRTQSDGSRLIYQVDRDGLVRPELALMIEPDGTFKHASLQAGELSVHRVQEDAEWNPIGVPLDPATSERAKRINEPIAALSHEGREGLTSILSLMGGKPSNEEKDLPFSPEVTVGRFIASATTLPWRAFWFPQKSGRLHNGNFSPMAKYDRFVSKRIGLSPEAQRWEKRVHPPRSYNWAGHCNGWSAASILRPEPVEPITDPFTGVTFTVSDQKGLWEEVDYCPKIAFFGFRNNGGGNDGDIRAIDFHKVVTYYIGRLRKPVIMDLMSNNPVENRVVSAYEMTVSRVRERVYRVATTLIIHSYDAKPNDNIGPAGTFKRTYTYLLETDERDRAVRGKWLSSHPDFFWVPLAPGDCDSKNPAVHEAWMKELYRLSQRPTSQSLTPSFGLMPAKEAIAIEDKRKPGAVPLPLPESTPSLNRAALTEEE